MFRCGSEEAAAAKACEVSQFYGLSVFGGWFVGTTEQLSKIGVPLSSIQHPKTCMCLACALCPVKPTSEPRKVRLEDGEDCDCDSCGVPLMPGESAWRCDTTFVTGCCSPCCADAARSKLALFGEEVAHV